jgi:hypothetical protein
MDKLLFPGKRVNGIVNPVNAMFKRLQELFPV